MAAGDSRSDVVSVIHRPGFAWSQFDLGPDLDVGALSVIAELDPTGANGVVEEVLSMFAESLEPVLHTLDALRRNGSVTDLRFEAHKLYSAAGQVGALRVARACDAITAHLRHEASNPPGSRDPVLETLQDELMIEIIRVQRRLRMLLGRG